MNLENKQCQNCKKDFIIEPDDFLFYEKIKVPAPTWCPECRLQRRFAWRNPAKLWRRHCMKEGCTNEFETSYAPDRPEIVYCEQCYQQEVA